jgi:hypothetical protein
MAEPFNIEEFMRRPEVIAAQDEVARREERAREANANGEDRSHRRKAGKPDFSPIFLDAIEVEDDPVCLVEGLLPIGPAFGLTAGAPKSLKSFFLMDIGLHVAAGLPYLGRKVQQGAVVYITSEGVRGVKRRLVAIRRHLGIEGKRVPFMLIPVMPNLGTGTADRAQLIANIDTALKPLQLPLAMAIIDTVRRATPGKDENSAKDMGPYIDNTDAIAKHFLCLVMNAHHSPRSEPSRGSGTNAIDGASDVIISVERKADTNRAIITLARMKDGEDGFSWSIELAPITIGIDRRGNPIVACAVKETELAKEDVKKAANQTAGRRIPKASVIALRALNEAVLECGEPAPASNHIPPNVRVTTIDRWRDYSYRRGISTGEDRARQKAFKNATEYLIGSGDVGVWNGQVWAAR